MEVPKFVSGATVLANVNPISINMEIYSARTLKISLNVTGILFSMQNFNVLKQNKMEINGINLDQQHNFLCQLLKVYKQRNFN